MIDIDKFVVSLLNSEELTKGEKRILHHALQEQGVRVKDGEIISIESDVPEMDFGKSEDEKIRKALLIYLDWLDGRKECAPRGGYTIKDMIAWVRQQKTVEWSEEDEKTLLTIIEKGDLKSSERVWLMSLRPQKQWKPSEEMLEALYRATPALVKEKSEDEILLDKLYQGLKYGRILSNN